MVTGYYNQHDKIRQDTTKTGDSKAKPSGKSHESLQKKNIGAARCIAIDKFRPLTGHTAVLKRRAQYSGGTKRKSCLCAEGKCGVQKRWRCRKVGAPVCRNWEVQKKPTSSIFSILSSTMGRRGLTGAGGFRGAGGRGWRRALLVMLNSDLLEQRGCSTDTKKCRQKYLWDKNRTLNKMMA